MSVKTENCEEVAKLRAEARRWREWCGRADVERAAAERRALELDRELRALREQQKAMGHLMGELYPWMVSGCV